MAPVQGDAHRKHHGHDFAPGERTGKLARINDVVTRLSLMVMRVILMMMMVMTNVPVSDLMALPTAPEAHKLGHQQVQADQSNQRIAHAFELVRPGIDLKPGASQRDEQHTDEYNRR
ncbi:MAG TPA: hypothetical protein VET25_11735 [Aestuariivirgaceae bacterium]|nr:hypothetical protein [Aestuariivirgaceae bacterium]